MALSVTRVVNALLCSDELYCPLHQSGVAVAGATNAVNSKQSEAVTGCLPFGEKIRKFRFEVKWEGNFPEIPFGNCGVPSGERRKFPYHLLNFPVSSLSSAANNYGKSKCKW